MKPLARIMCFAFTFVLIGPAAFAQTGPVKVYILVGQSNMEGHARVETIPYIGDDPATKPLYDAMHDATGEAKVCDGVWISYLTGRGDNNGEGFGKLTSGYGSRNNPAEDGGKIGPEFTFGITMDEAIDEPILIIKTAWGGKSLHTDFRSPSAGSYQFNEREIARFEQQDKDMAQARADKDKATGHYYRLMIDHVETVLSDISRVYPGYDEEQGYEIAGFVWFQAWNDMVDSGVYPDRDKPGGYYAYSEGLTHFIRDVRKDLEAPDMNFVIGVVGVEGPLDKYTDQRIKNIHGNFRKAMAVSAGLPEFRGNVTAVATDPYWDAPLAAIDAKRGKIGQMARFLRTNHRDHANKDGTMSEQEQKDYVANYRAELISPEDEAKWERGASNAGYHYLGCAKTMALIGQAFARALLEMEATRSP